MRFIISEEFLEVLLKSRVIYRKFGFLRDFRFQKGFTDSEEFIQILLEFRIVRVDLRRIHRSRAWTWSLERLTNSKELI